MTIEMVRNKINCMIGKRVKIVLDVGRNKTEEIEGIIREIYPFIFLVETTQEVKTFMYADVLTKTIKLKVL